MFRLLDDCFFSELSHKAAKTDRKRLNHNIHATLDDPIQRLCNAFEPETYVRPHRHPDPGKWELFILLRGRMAVVFFNKHGCLLQRVELDAKGPNRIIEIAEKQWHTVISLAPETVVFELKPGPYSKPDDKDFAPWAPAEGHESVPAFLDWFKHGGTNSYPPISSEKSLLKEELAQ